MMRRLGESDEIGEHHAERLDAVGDALLPRFQTVGNRRGHDRADQRVGAVILELQLELGAPQRRQGVEQDEGEDAQWR